MKTKARCEVVTISTGFDYAILAAGAAARARTVAERIRERVKRTLEGLVAVGNDLVAVKAELPHGSFGPWLKAEFGWNERTARNYMAVAEAFGSKTEIISDFGIAPTAAYLLAAPSTPEEALQAAIAQAEAGEQITVAAAREIVAAARKRGGHPSKRLAEGKVIDRLDRALERCQAKLGVRHWPRLAQRLREFADRLESPRRESARSKPP